MPVAFLLTEILELLQISQSFEPLVISLEESNIEGKHTLILTSDALKDNIEFDSLMADGIDRVILGLSRQLRAELVRDRNMGTMKIDIEIIDAINIDTDEDEQA